MKVSISKVQTPVGITLEKTKFSISKQLVNPKRQLKNEKKKAEYFGIFVCLLLPKNPSNQSCQLS